MLDAVRRERARRSIERDMIELSAPGSLSRFVAASWHTLKPAEAYHHSWHIDAVCDKLEAVTAGEIKRLQVWLPPGMTKTMVISVMWHAWEWTQFPWLRYWSASYETRLAGRIASMSRDLMLHPWYQDRWGHLFQFDRDAEHLYSNNMGGTRLATAPKSTAQGEHGHRIVIDDPINAAEAEATSKVNLDQVKNWWDGSVGSRGIDNKELPEAFRLHAQVIVMQRLHEEDLCAHAMKSDDWEVLCLPERYEPDHPFVWPDDPREPGDLLDPGRRDDKQSDALFKKLGSHRAAGQLQQRPSAREGNMLKRDWWRFYDPRIRAQDDWGKLPKFAMVVISADTPLKDKETSDNVAVQCWGVRGADRYLLDLRYGKMNYGLAKRTIREMAQWARRNWTCPHYILIENAGYGVELIVDLKREVIGVTKIDPSTDGNKETRADSASDALESGNCFLPGYGPPWQPAHDELMTPADVNEFIDNCARFPHASHDDDVDSWSQAMNFLKKKQTTPMRISTPTRRRAA